MHDVETSAFGTAPAPAFERAHIFRHIESIFEADSASILQPVRSSNIMLQSTTANGGEGRASSSADECTALSFEQARIQYLLCAMHVLMTVLDDATFHERTCLADVSNWTMNKLKSLSFWACAVNCHARYVLRNGEDANCLAPRHKRMQDNGAHENLYVHCGEHCAEFRHWRRAAAMTARRLQIGRNNQQDAQEGCKSWFVPENPIQKRCSVPWQRMILAWFVAFFCLPIALSKH